MTKSSSLISLLENDFEYRTLDDLLNTVRQLEPGNYDLSGVEAVFTTSAKHASLDAVQEFITKYHKVCYVMIEGYSDEAKNLVLMSDEPKKVGMAKSIKDTGVIVYRDRLFANNLQR